MEWWSSGGERGKSWILAFSSGLFSSLSRTSRWAGGPRDQAGTCRAPEPSPWLLTGQFQVLKWQWTSPPSPPWPPNDHSRLCIMRSEGPAPLCGRSEEPEGQLPLGRLAPSAKTAGWKWPWGAASWDLPPLSQDLDLRGWKLCLGTLHFLVRIESNNLFGGDLFEHHYQTMTWPEEQDLWH